MKEIARELEHREAVGAHAERRKEGSEEGLRKAGEDVVCDVGGSDVVVHPVEHTVPASHHA
eukprot:1200348-Rhodomonas_salina.3